MSIEQACNVPCEDDRKKPDRGSLLVYEHLGKLKVFFITSVALGSFEVGKSSVLLNPILLKAAGTVFGKRSHFQIPPTQANVFTATSLPPQARRQK